MSSNGYGLAIIYKECSKLQDRPYVSTKRNIMLKVTIEKVGKLASTDLMSTGRLAITK